MLTRRMAAPMMRRGGRRMRQMQELREENERLRAEVENLRLTLVAEIAANASEDDWDDLDPDPHGAANDTPGSQPEACDTKSAKSITSAVSKEAE